MDSENLKTALGINTQGTNNSAGAINLLSILQSAATPSVSPSPLPPSPLPPSPFASPFGNPSTISIASPLAPFAFPPPPTASPHQSAPLDLLAAISSPLTTHQPLQPPSLYQNPSANQIRTNQTTSSASPLSAMASPLPATTNPVSASTSASASASATPIVPPSNTIPISNSPTCDLLSIITSSSNPVDASASSSTQTLPPPSPFTMPSHMSPAHPSNSLPAIFPFSISAQQPSQPQRVVAESQQVHTPQASAPTPTPTPTPTSIPTPTKASEIPQKESTSAAPRDTDAYLQSKLSTKYSQIPLPRGDSVFDIDNDSPKPHQLPTTPITQYSFGDTWARYQLSVSGKYLAFTIKGETARIHNFSSGARGLHKLHTGPILGLSLSQGSPVLLATISTDSTLFVTSIQESDQDHQPKILPTFLYGIKRADNLHFTSLTWHPQNANCLALTGSEGSVMVVNLNKLELGMKSSHEERDIPNAITTLSTNSKFYTCISFSSTGSHLMASSRDGTLTIWELETCRVVLETTPYADKGVEKVFFLGSSQGSSEENTVKSRMFVTVSSQFHDVTLWELTLQEAGAQVSRLQNINLVSKMEKNFVIVLDQTSSVISLAHASSPQLFALHLSEPKTTTGIPVTTNDFRFDCVSRFSLHDVVLNMAVANIHCDQNLHYSQKLGDPSDLEIQYTCIHPRSIQTYEVLRWNLRPSESVSTPGAVTVSVEPQASPKTPHKADRISKATVSVPSSATEVGSIPNPSSGAEAASVLPISSSNIVLSTATGNTITQDSERKESDASVAKVNRNTPGGSSRKPHQAQNGKDQLKSAPREESTVEQANPDKASVENSLPDQGRVSVHSLGTAGLVTPPSFSSDGTDSQFKRLETTVVTKADKIAQQYSDKFYARINKDFSEQQRSNRAEFEKLDGRIRELQAEMARQSQATGIEIQKALGQMNENITKLAEGTFSKIADQVKTSLVQKVEKQLKDISKKSVESAIPEITSIVANSAAEQLRSVFEKTYVPQTQAAIQDMTRQVGESFSQLSKGMNETLVNRVQVHVVGSLNQRISDLEKHVAQQNEITLAKIRADNERLMEATLASLQQQHSHIIHVEIQSMKQAMSAMQHVVQQISGQPTSPQPVVDPRESVMQDLAARNFLSAFEKALSLQDLSFLISACQAADVVSALESIRKNQVVVLSLIQQLGHDLSNNLQVKVPWLVESIYVLDFSDRWVVLHGDEIMKEILKNIQSLDSNDVAAYGRDLRHLRWMIENHFSSSSSKKQN